MKLPICCYDLYLTVRFSKSIRIRRKFMANAKYVRQADTCPEGTAFYKCAVGPFTGCCSHNPCDTGLCGDIEDCNSRSQTQAQASPPKMSEEQTTTLTATVTDVIMPLTTTVTVSDIVTSLVTEPAASTTLQVATSSTALHTHTSDLNTSPSSLDSSPSSSYLSPGSTVTETPVSSIPIPAATNITASTNSSKASSSWIIRTSSATAIPTNSKSPHTTAVVGGIFGGLSFLAFLTLVLLCCCFRKRAKYGFRMKRKSKEDKEEQERAELLQKAEEASLQRQAFLGTAISTGAQSPVNKIGMGDSGPSPYPRNSTAVPPLHWI
jgi:hypothetical protein